MNSSAILYPIGRHAPASGNRDRLVAKKPLIGSVQRTGGRANSHAIRELRTRHGLQLGSTRPPAA